ncbi:hypothetical protein [Kribbella sp. NPDC004875]|uniref:hypothetical protein n=1 Tax=Kribbella sp. NPDC004875 TaxID=3364107 RepID=UPI0036C85CFB
MSTLLDRLHRFRPVGTPGGAGPVGVPVDSRGGVPAELVAVFEALDDVIAECQDIRARAARRADGMVATARTDAAGLISDARKRAVGEQAEAAAAVRARGGRAADQPLAAATAQAALLRDGAAQRMERLVEFVLERVRAEAGVEL